MREYLIDVWPKEGCKTLLDLGCRDCWHTAGLPGVQRHVGVDIWLDALQRGIDKNLPGFEPVCIDALECLEAIESRNAFEAVLAIDLYEHLERARALKMIEEMERVCSKIAVVWTTLGYIEQGPYDVDGEHNPYEAHQPWAPRPATFENRGWQLHLYEEQHGVRGGAFLAVYRKE